MKQLLANYNVFSDDLKRYGIEHAIKHTTSLGFDAVEIFDCCEGNLPVVLDPKRASRAISQAGLRVACYSVLVDLSVPNQEKTEAMLFRHMELASSLGSPYFHHTLIPHYSWDAELPSYDEVLDHIVVRAKRIADHAAQLGLVCLYEPQGAYFNGKHGLGRFFEKIQERCSNVGICADAGNPLFVDENPADIFEYFAKYIRHVHVKDYQMKAFDPEAKDKSKSGKALFKAKLGAGAAALETCFAALRSVDYQGAVSFEIDAEDQDMEKAIQYVQKLLR